MRGVVNITICICLLGNLGTAGVIHCIPLNVCNCSVNVTYSICTR
jgi:hypothetical protein